MCWFIQLEISTVSGIKYFDKELIESTTSEFQIMGDFPIYRIEKNGCLCRSIDDVLELEHLNTLLTQICDLKEVKSLKITKYWNEPKRIKRTLEMDINELKQVLIPELESDLTLKITNKGKFQKHYT
jgi:hypothetical protein